MICQVTHLLMKAHEVIKYPVRESSVINRTKLLVAPLNFWPRFQRLDEALEVGKIQEPALLDVSLLHRLSATQNENRGTTRALKRRDRSSCDGLTLSRLQSLSTSSK